MADKRTIPISTVTKITTFLVLALSVSLLAGTAWFVSAVFDDIHRPQIVEPDAIKTQQINMRSLQDALAKNAARTGKAPIATAGLQNPFVVVQPPAAQGSAPTR